MRHVYQGMRGGVAWLVGGTTTPVPCQLEMHCNYDVRLISNTLARCHKRYLNTYQLPKLNPPQSMSPSKSNQYTEISKYKSWPPPLVFGPVTYVEEAPEKIHRNQFRIPCKLHKILIWKFTFKWLFPKCVPMSIGISFSSTSQP